ncbi:hypothetical protein SAMN05444166_2009 [Singulisphaera sp. GP187]|nr:hypothetical protein SAMN05444166_2009 [Singulisphaera sp. GP187]
MRLPRLTTQRMMLAVASVKAAPLWLACRAEGVRGHSVRRGEVAALSHSNQGRPDDPSNLGGCVSMRGATPRIDMPRRPAIMRSDGASVAIA